MATAFIWGVNVPGQPYLSVNQHFKEGEEFKVDFVGEVLVYEVYQADEVNREDQAQNVYVRKKGE